MDVDSPQLKAYLYKLNEMTHADPAAQVSMYEVGEALGVENDEAGQMAETLFMGGHAELKTLSGGIGITLMGMEALGVTPAVAPGLETPALGNEIVLTDPDRNHVDTLLGDIKSGMASAKAEYQVLETLVMDIKTIEVQMLSPDPKTAVIREVLKSISQTLPEKEFPKLINRISGMIKKG